MDNNKEIFLPDTTVKLGTLKEKLSDVYGLSVITKTQRNIIIGAFSVLTGFVLYSFFKKKWEKIDVSENEKQFYR